MVNFFFTVNTSNKPNCSLLTGASGSVTSHIGVLFEAEGHGEGNEIEVTTTMRL